MKGHQSSRDKARPGVERRTPAIFMNFFCSSSMFPNLSAKSLNGAGSPTSFRSPVSSRKNWTYFETTCRHLYRAHYDFALRLAAAFSWRFVFGLTDLEWLQNLANQKMSQILHSDPEIRHLIWQIRATLRDPARPWSDGKRHLRDICATPARR